jgi:soluble lytic murein transglycosylase
MNSKFFWPLLALIFFPMTAFGDAIYICRKPDGVPLFTNVPNECGYPVKRWGGNGSSNRAVAADFDELIRSASERHGVDSELVRAVIKVESDFNADARSRKGAQGLMQLMPETARLHRVSDAYDPRENIEGGVRHLRLLLDHYAGGLELSLAAYNAGIKAVEKHRGIPPFAETKEYVKRVLWHYDRYRKRSSG